MGKVATLEELGTSTFTIGSEDAETTLSDFIIPEIVHGSEILTDSRQWSVTENVPIHEYFNFRLTDTED